MSNGLFYGLGISFCLGILSASTFAVNVYHMLWLLVIAGSLGLIVLRRRSQSALLVFAVCIVSLVVGAGSTLHERSGSITFLGSSGLETEYAGIVVREPEQRERSMHLYVAYEDEILLAYVDRYTPVTYGDYVHLSGERVLPEAFTTELGRTFNYPGYLESKGVETVMFYPTVEVIDHGGGNPVYTMLYAFKDRFREALQATLPVPQVALGEGLLLGVNGVLGEEWEAVFRKTGIIHIVVLSGYNIMLVVIFVQYALSFLLPYRTRLLVGFVAIALFAILVGFSATVLRASVMASILLLLRFSGNTYNVLRGLMLAGVIMLMWNPLLLVYDPGFQLSFLATLGLLLLAPHLERLCAYIPSWGNMREFVVATLATQILVLPFLLYQIGEFSLVAVVVNVLVLPMVPIAMLLTFITGMVALITPALASVVGVAAQVSLLYILEVAALFAALPFASFEVPAFPLWSMLLSYGVIFYGIYYLYVGRQQRRPLRNWTIEEESVVQKRATATSDEAAVVPVFFR